jgi:hypothetical protein
MQGGYSRPSAQNQQCSDYCDNRGDEYDHREDALDVTLRICWIVVGLVGPTVAIGVDAA